MTTKIVSLRYVSVKFFFGANTNQDVTSAVLPKSIVELGQDGIDPTMIERKMCILNDNDHDE